MSVWEHSLKRVLDEVLIKLFTSCFSLVYVDREERESYIRAKYIDKEFLQDLPSSQYSLSQVHFEDHLTKLLYTYIVLWVYFHLSWLK